MGILNVTPDSFSDGGLFFNEFEAYNQADNSEGDRRFYWAKIQQLTNSLTE